MTALHNNVGDKLLGVVAIFGNRPVSNGIGKRPKRSRYIPPLPPDPRRSPMATIYLAPSPEIAATPANAPCPSFGSRAQLRSRCGQGEYTTRKDGAGWNVKRRGVHFWIRSKLTAADR